MEETLEMWKLALYGAVIFGANTVQALTGFAGTLLTLPPYILLFGPDLAKAVANVAGWIQKRTGGDLFPIRVKESYSSDYEECLARAAEEKAENARPELAARVRNMDDYDVVFLGYPNWWYTLPMPVLSFLEEYDFSGKTVIPFCAHGTGGLAESVSDLRAALPASAQVGEPIGVYRPEVDGAESRIDAWLASAGW